MNLGRVLVLAVWCLGPSIAFGNNSDNPDNPFEPPPLQEDKHVPSVPPGAVPVPVPDPEEAARRREREAAEAARKKAEAARRAALKAAEKKLFEKIVYVGVVNGNFLYWDPEAKCHLVFRKRPKLANLVRDGCGYRVWVRANP